MDIAVANECVYFLLILFIVTFSDLRHSKLFVVALLLGVLLPTTAWGKKGHKKSLATTELSDSLRYEQKRDEARRDYFYFAALENQLADGSPHRTFDLMFHVLEIDSTFAPARYFMAEQYAESGQLEPALYWAQGAVRHDSTQLWYGLMEASLLQQLKRPTEAIRSYERLLKHHPDNTEICEELCELYLSIDSVRDCVRMMEHIEEIEGVDPKLSMQKFYLYQHLQEPDSAFASLSKLIARYPYNAIYRIINGDMLLKAGRTEEALSNYDAARSLDADHPRLWVSMTHYYTVTGDTIAAETTMRNALAHPNLELNEKLEILTDYLRNYLQQRAQDSILQSTPLVDDLFATVINTHPTEPEPYVLQAKYLEAIGQDSLALAHYADAVDLRPAEEDYWVPYIYLTYQKRGSEAVLTTTAQALTYIPNFVTAYLVRASAFAEEQRNDEALESYRQALNVLPAEQILLRSQVYGYMGDIYQNVGQMDSAYAAYDLALKYNGENINVLNNYSYFLALEGIRLDQAERMMSIVIRKQPDVATYLDTYAWVYFRLGNFSLAKFYQKRALTCEGEQPSATLLEHYGDILYGSGETEEAMEYWKRAAALPDCDSKTLPEKIRTGKYIEEPLPWAK